MIILARSIVLVSLLSGCTSIGTWGGPVRGVDPYAAAVYGVPDAIVVTRPPEMYTRAEIDAINADMMCRTLARNPLEIQRCGLRR